MLGYISYSIGWMTVAALPADFESWPPLEAYGSKTIDNWRKPDSAEGRKAWAAFEGAQAEFGSDRLWLQAGMKRETGWEPTRIAKGIVSVIDLAHGRVGSTVSIFLSGMSPYPQGSAGDLHAAVADVDQAVTRVLSMGLPYVHAGPVMAELTDDLVIGDGIHPNDAGAAILAADLTSFQWG